MRKQIQEEQQLGKYYTIVIEVNYYFKFINTAHNGSMLLTHYHHFFILTLIICYQKGTTDANNF